MVIAASAECVAAHGIAHQETSALATVAGSFLPGAISSMDSAWPERFPRDITSGSPPADPKASGRLRKYLIIMLTTKQGN